MYKGSRKPITDLAHPFLVPTNASHRQYEALRAYFLEQLPWPTPPSASATPPVASASSATSSDRIRSGRSSSPPRQDPTAPKRVSRPRTRGRPAQAEPLHLRHRARPRGIRTSLCAPPRFADPQGGGLCRLPRRRDEERRPRRTPGCEVPTFDNSISPRTFRTASAGCSSSSRIWSRLRFDQVLEKAGFPGSKMIPAGHALRSLLALKLFGNARHSHVMSSVFDEGLALFRGTQRDPQALLPDRVQLPHRPACYPKFMRGGSMPWQAGT